MKIFYINGGGKGCQGFLALQDCVYTIGKGWVGRKDVIFIKAHKIFHVSQGYLGAKWFMCLVRKS